MLKRYFIALIINLIFFGGVLLFVQELSLLIFIILIYLVPMMLNFLFFQVNKKLDKKWIFSFITVLSYCIFSYIFMKQDAFMNFVVNNTQEIGNLSVQVHDNLLSLGQIIFVFTINYGVIYLLNKFSKEVNTCYK